MLEPLVSSRIRRTVLEFLLAHPNDRFYLRGLSKELGLSVSPLRRELKRLERSGMLQAVAEGNILFYTVNAQSPAFQQLCALRASERPVTPGRAFAPLAAASVLPPAQAGRNFFGLRRLQFSAAAAAITFAVAVGVYFGISGHKTQVTMIAPTASPSASGAMRGGHWRVVPGSFGGGFSSESSNAESY